MNIFKKIVTKKISALDKNKIYVVQLPLNTTEDESTELTTWAKLMTEQYSIQIVYITENMSFVELPKGYEIKPIRIKTK